MLHLVGGAHALTAPPPWPDNLYVLGGDLVIPLLEGVMSHRSHLAAGFREYLIMREPLGRWFDFDSEDRDECQPTSSESGRS
jgi:hypothetical protein